MLRDLCRTRQVPSYATADQNWVFSQSWLNECQTAWSGGTVCPWCAENAVFKHPWGITVLVPSLSFSLSCRSMTAVCAHPGFQRLLLVCNHFDCLYHVALVHTGFHDTLFYYKSFCRSCHSSWRVRSASHNVPLCKTNHREMGVCFSNAQCLESWSKATQLNHRLTDSLTHWLNHLVTQ